MNIAIIGAGISGLTAAYYLRRGHDITIYESAPRIGGHTATVDVRYAGRDYAIDTGFIVYNDWTYPKFIELIAELGVETRPTEMSFSVRCDDNGLEYGGNNLNTLFAQRINLMRPSFHRMLRDILRFNREAVKDLDSGRISATTTLGDYLAANRYCEEFTYRYLLPMGCAIWSASTSRMIDFPVLFFTRFFKNHGLLSVNDRPQWHVIKGGSRSYLEPLTREFSDSICVNAQIVSVRRRPGGVELVMANGHTAQYDQVIFACHSDQALGLLADATMAERDALTAIPYQSNEVVLHTDESLLPRRRLAWSSWNYWLRERYQQRAILTYNMNILQGIESDTNFCVTLNATESIAADKIIETFNYSHPVFSLESVVAAAKIDDFNGLNRTWFAGAYLGNGFHEDGVVSGRRVADAINRLAPSAPRDSLAAAETSHA
ncbi:MAG: FAD-dependent oxidoreductase [Gammaproteobacteria bacterium]|nr:FAD-dependent oxidoreductase [Gammaproteobacteria bacterium]MDH3446510.1 FAD-dependent oxidoreductase [Gammaproteobacteria bacterium]